MNYSIAAKVNRNALHLIVFAQPKLRELIGYI